MSHHAFLVPIAIAGLTLTAIPAFAVGTNLVQNGDFEISNATDPSFVPSLGGIGQVVNATGGPGGVLLSNWTKVCLKDCGSTSALVFVLDDKADDRISGAAFPNQGGGFPSLGSADASSNIFLWGPDNQVHFSNNGFTGSPNGGKFVGIDGDFGRGLIKQTITGLDTSKTYQLSFEYAGSQFAGQNGATSQEWRIRYNGIQQTVGPWTNPTHGFTPWQTQTYSFQPTTTSFDLEFEAYGSIGTGLPPFLLLDNVAIFETTPTPPPGPGPSADPAPGPLPLVGFGAALGWSRRLRRSLRAAS